MDRCFNCKSVKLLITDENVTCTDCSRVQKNLYYGESRFYCENENEASNAFLDENIERMGLGKLDKSVVESRLRSIKHAKSVFSKLDLVISLIYLNKIERGVSLSAQAFSSSLGYLITARQLSNCSEYLKEKLKLTEIGSCLSWEQLLRPYCEMFVYLKPTDLELMKKICEKVRQNSNLSVYSIAAIVFVLCFTKGKGKQFAHILDEVSIFANISKTTLKRNCIKYSLILKKVCQ